MTIYETICDRHNIKEDYRHEIDALIRDGELPSRALGVRLQCADPYRACLSDLLDVLSIPVYEKYFPHLLETP